MYMMMLPLLAVLAVFQTVSALRPKNVTICDYYTPIVTGQDNSPSSQQELMIKITNTFILGNYTTPNVGIAVHGVATPGIFKGHGVYMLPYFDGGYASTNDGGPNGVAKNFLDDGGAVALEMSKPANTMNSNQYTLLTHVYQYFGAFYGCSEQGSSPDFPSYQGVPSMYEVHKYMDLDPYQTGWFNEQILLAIASLGFEQPDIDFTKTALETVFGNRCSPAAKVIPPEAGPQLQSICAAPECPLDPNADCAAYPNGGPVAQPLIANSTLVGNVTQQNETAAAPTAVWPSHCVVGRDASGKETCSTSTSAPSSTSSPNAANIKSGAEMVSVGWLIAAALTGIFYFQ